MIDVVILTSSKDSVAAHHLPFLLKSEKISIRMVIVSKGLIKDKNAYYNRKWKKILKIGFLGTINGIRMRKWYNDDVKLIHQSIALDRFCKENNIEYYETAYTNSEQTIELFKSSGATVGLSLGNGFISKKVFSIPQYGMINIHHEILPDFQNAQSVIWQIYNGSKHSGYTIHKIDSKIDTGEIIYQQKIPIKLESNLRKTVSSTVVQIENEAVKGLIEVLENFEFYFKFSREQLKGNNYTTPTFFQFIKIYRNFLKLKSNNDL